MMLKYLVNYFSNSKNDNKMFIKTCFTPIYIKLFLRFVCDDKVLNK